MDECEDPSTKTILVVDDDEDVRSFLETILEMDGYKVQMAGDGKEALAKVQQKAPDLVITDLMMPDAGGYEVLRGLQASENSRLPIIVNTARQLDASTEDMIRAEANVVEFLHKPISIAILQSILFRILKTRPKKR